MLGNLNGPTMLVILAIVLLLFGAPKLPGLAKSIGQSMKILKKEVRSDDASGASDQASDSPAASTTQTAAAEKPAESKPADPEKGSDTP